MYPRTSSTVLHKVSSLKLTVRATNEVTNQLAIPAETESSVIVVTSRIEIETIEKMQEAIQRAKCYLHVEFSKFDNM